MSATPPLVVVVAPVFRIAKHFCRFQHEPPLNPMSREVIIVTQMSDAYRLRGIGQRQVKLHVVGNSSDIRRDVLEKVREILTAQPVVFVRA